MSVEVIHGKVQLVCELCDARFQVERRRGRYPKTCPSCRRGPASPEPDGIIRRPLGDPGSQLSPPDERPVFIGDESAGIEYVLVANHRPRPEHAYPVPMRVAGGGRWEEAAHEDADTVLYWRVDPGMAA